jgi:hypothetical protein|tara:strand:- start:1165 stop:1581 length:417 start_codon:yes stop_codon:yes gene_type:complete
MNEGKIAKTYDNSKTNEEGVYINNYAFDLTDGTRLYCREKLDPIPQPNSTISYVVKGVKTSANGNQYSNVESVKVIAESSQPVATTNGANGFKPDANKDRLIFVTGVVGRAMGSGNFSEEKIDVITERAIASFNKHLG